ncbi:MAG: hypothetical protein IJA55_06220 [Clostridia bacterium]|nr:hypothetical protein [Clostridia bacterium]
MDLISSNPKFKRKILIIWSVLLFLLHTLFTLLSLYDGYISGDIMQQGMDKALGVILPIIALLIIYIRYGVLVSAYHSYERGTLPFTMICVGSLICSRISEHIIYVSQSSAVNPLSYLLSFVTSFMIDLAVVLLLLLFSRGQKERKRKVIRLILIACVFPLIITIFEETWYLINILIEIKAEYGNAALTGTEIGSVIWSFTRPVINAVIGFVIMLVTHKILKKQKLRVQ